MRDTSAQSFNWIIKLDNHRINNLVGIQIMMSSASSAFKPRTSESGITAACVRAGSGGHTVSIRIAVLQDNTGALEDCA